MTPNFLTFVQRTSQYILLKVFCVPIVVGMATWCNSSSFYYLLKVSILMYSLFIWYWWMSMTCLHSHYYNLILFNDSNDSKYVSPSIDSLYEILSQDNGNNISEFMQSNCIMVSYYSSPKHKSLIPKYLIHFSHFCTQ